MGRTPRGLNVGTPVGGQDSTEKFAPCWSPPWVRRTQRGNSPTLGHPCVEGIKDIEKRKVQDCCEEVGGKINRRVKINERVCEKKRSRRC